MYIAIIADIHANIEAFTAVLSEIDRRKPDAILCLGDLSGYNASPNEVLDIAREREIPTIMGNHDAAVCGLEEPWFFRAAARKAVEWQLMEMTERNKKWLVRAPEQMIFARHFLAVHGAPSCRDDYIVDWLDAMRQLEHLERRELSICFFGHSHRPSFFSEKGSTQMGMTEGIQQLRPMNRYFINPGSVGQPRDGDPRACYGFLDTDKVTFEFCRVEYDIESCARRIMQAGLPAELAKRLSKGK